MSDLQPGVLPALDEPGDAELISAVRAGDLEAYGTLFERHVDAARRLARQLVSAGDVDDLVSEAFAKVLGVLQKGGGPDLAFRAYLLTSLRRLHVDKLRSSARLTTTDDMSAYDPGVPFEDTAVAGFDSHAAARAFAQLPERWQQVLWHTEVEGQKPAEIAPLLGMSANSVSALAYRAREGLRQAFISMHAQDAVEESCTTTRANLGAYIRGGLSKRDSAKVEAHLRECRACTAIYLELTEVNSNLGALLAPLLLGSAGAAYLASAGAGAKAGVLLFLGRGRDWVLHNPIGRVAAGATAAAVVAVAVVAVAAQGGSHPHHTPQAINPPSASASSTTPAPPAVSSAAPPARSTPAHTPKPSPPARSTSSPRPTPNLRPPPAASPAPVTPPVTPPLAVPSPPPAPPAVPPGTAPIIMTPLANVTATPGRSVVIDLTKGATAANGHPVTVKSANLVSPSHGTLAKGTGTGRPMISGAGRAGLSGAVPLLVRPAAGTRTVTYTPDPGWRGTDTITYTLTDGHGGTARGSVKVITPNTPPVAHPIVISARTTSSSAVPASIWPLRHATDANHDPLTLTITKPRVGTATKRADGRVHYVAKPAAHSYTDRFRYTVRDGHGGQDTATVTIHVVAAAPSPPPVSDAGLRLVSKGNAGQGTVRLVITAYAIPKGKNATFNFALTGPGKDSLKPDSSSACGKPALSGRCTVGNGQALDLHFQPKGQWSFTASLTPKGFDDPSPTDNKVNASGAPSGPPSAHHRPGGSPQPRRTA